MWYSVQQTCVQGPDTVFLVGPKGPLVRREFWNDNCWFSKTHAFVPFRLPSMRTREMFRVKNHNTPLRCRHMPGWERNWHGIL